MPGGCSADCAFALEEGEGEMASKAETATWEEMLRRMLSPGATIPEGAAGNPVHHYYNFFLQNY